MINKTNRKNVRPFSQRVGLINLFIAIVIAASLFLGCDTGSESDVEIDRHNNGEDAGDVTKPDGSVDQPTEPEPSAYSTALVITTDYQSGAYSTIALDDHTVEKDVAFIHSDAMCRFDLVTETPFFVLRLGSDAIDVLNPNTFEIDEEYSVEPASNPQDIAVVSADRAYVSRLELNEILIVEPLTGDEIGTVDLSEYADDDGIAEIAGMQVMDGMVYALVQRIDRDNNWTPAGTSYLVAIDAETGEIEGDFELAGTNPYEAIVYSEVLEKFIISEAGDFSDLENAGVEFFDPVEQTLSGFIVTEQELGGNVTKAVAVSETKGYALIGVEGENGNDTHVVIFNPETGKKTGTLIETEGWNYGNIVLTPDQTELWVSDRTTEKPGIRIFDTETDEEKTDEPIDVGLPPSYICFTL
jgi:DNA-binding beta-propeller fold protein YncE